MPSTLKDYQDGVRFWLPCQEVYEGIPPKIAEYPWPKETSKGFPRRMRFAHIADPNTDPPRPIEITGEAYYADPGTVAALAREALGNQFLRFDPQQVIDKGILSVEEMAALGYPGLSPSDKKAAGLPAETREVIPSFDTMECEEIRTWADAHGIFIESNLTQGEMVKKVRAALKKKEKKERSK